METGLRSYGEELVAVLSAASAALRELPVCVSRLTGAELDTLLPVVDELGALAAAGRFTLTADADERGEVAQSQAGSVRQWVTDRCRALEPRDAGIIARAVRELTPPDMEPVRQAVLSGRLSVPAGCVVATELRQLRPLLAPGAEDAVLAGLVGIGETHGCTGVRQLRPALLARYGLGAALQDLDDRRAGLTSLSCGKDIGGGITEYRMRLAPEARAVVEAAINTLSAPRVTEGTRDSRTAEQRRGDALVAVCARSTEYSPNTLPSGVKATVLVTIGLDALRERTRPGTLLGGLDAGTLLGPETVRKLACDAAVIPAVLGGDGQILDLGASERLFTRPQIKALWLRDRHCSFPGCRTPATWCDAHHIRHWADGGPTDLGNGTLVCPRHHTIVHRDRLVASITPEGVHWDRRHGSYDRALARGSLPDADEPPPLGRTG